MASMSDYTWPSRYVAGKRAIIKKGENDSYLVISSEKDYLDITLPVDIEQQKELMLALAKAMGLPPVLIAPGEKDPAEWIVSLQDAKEQAETRAEAAEAELSAIKARLRILASDRVVDHDFEGAIDGAISNLQEAKRVFRESH